MTLEGNLTSQELHQLAMTTVGSALEELGYEFLAVNSQLKKDPQFVCLKNNKLFFIVVQAVSYPNDPKKFDQQLLDQISTHAAKFKATTFYAGVGLAHAEDYTKKLKKNDPYVINYEGLQAV